MASSVLKSGAPPAMKWGSAPELIGPRHVYRVDRLARCLHTALPTGTVLDAGCGAGALTERLVRMGYSVLAVDDSEAFIEHTSVRLDALGFGHRARVWRDDLQALDLPPESIDGAVCGDVLEHLPDDAAAVGAIAGALRPGGVFALTVPAGSERYDWLDEWAGHERRYDEAGLRGLLTDAGLRIEQITRFGFPFLTLYERFVMRPGLAHSSTDNGSQSLVARLARSRPVTLGIGALFHADELFERGHRRGTGFLARARKP